MSGSLNEKSRVSLPEVALASLVLGVAGGVAGAVTTAYSMREQLMVQIRDEQNRELAYYVTREELALTRERDRDRVDGKLDVLSVEVKALGLAVARLRR